VSESTIALQLGQERKSVDMSPIRLLRVKVRTVHQQIWSSPGVYDEKSPGRNKFFGQSFPAWNP